MIPTIKGDVENLAFYSRRAISLVFSPLSKCAHGLFFLLFPLKIHPHH